VYRATPATRAKAAAVRERIVAAALAQLADGGYASASVATVARRAGVATGSVYRHFPSKGELFAEVFRRAAQREVDALEGLGLAACVETFVRRALAAPARAYALIAEPVDPAVERERLRFRRAYADLFVRLVGDELVATAIVGALAEALVGPLADRDRDPDALVAGLQSFVLSAVEGTTARVH
jgi:AcrR family transcriptional regulator